MSAEIPNPEVFTTVANSKATISSTPILLSDLLSLDANSQRLLRCNIFNISVENNDIRVFDNGNIPTSSLGVLMKAGALYKITAPPTYVRFIRVSSDAVINIIPYKA